MKKYLNKKMMNQSHQIKLFLCLLFLAVATILTSCADVYNSSSTDKLIYGNSETEGSKFQAARSGLLNKCSQCHSFYGTWSESQFLTDSTYGIIARDPANSPLYCHSRGNDTCGPGDMPLSGSDMTATELAKIKDWILSL
ncbi:MAG: hypothetical protein ACK5P5_09485 [Pseudobdellovibrionaceae bacterium]